MALTSSRTAVRSTSEGGITERIEARFGLLALFVGSIWAAFFISAALPGLHLDSLGVIPRRVVGLRGILFAPFLHASLAHIMANTGGLVILGWLTMWPRLEGFWSALAGSMIGAGLCAWSLGAPGSVHIGASGVVFGFAGYLIARGWYTRNFLSVIVALFVMFSYGISMLFGVLPINPLVSWQSHLGGTVGGILAARLSAPAHRK
ncbi:rhomboid family intramembrane serine protease [Paraburkholderia youngii]|uniref:rhomboid family intramembrane serine protease n=1 Tax=Paraburkholderia youngii TaxID=2782701 RepID=UPI003D192BA2